MSKMGVWVPWCVALATLVAQTTAVGYVDLGSNTACRGEIPAESSGRVQSYVAATHVATEQECVALCNAIKPCYGIEYCWPSNSGICSPNAYANCELWLVPIINTKAVSEFKCQNNTATYASPPAAGLDSVTAGFNVSNLNVAFLLASASLTNITAAITSEVEQSIHSSRANVDANVSVVLGQSGSDLHVRIVFASSSVHAVTLHNSIRALAVGKKLTGWDGGLSAVSGDSLTTSITKYFDSLSSSFRISNVTVSWDFTTLTSLASVLPTNNPAGATTTKSGGGGLAGVATTASVTQAALSVVKASATVGVDSCPTARSMASDPTVASAFESSLAQTLTCCSAGDVQANLTARNCRRLSEQNRRLSAPSVQADFTITVPAGQQQPAYVDTSIFSSALTAALGNTSYANKTVSVGNFTVVGTPTPAPGPTQGVKKVDQSSACYPRMAILIGAWLTANML